MTIHDHNTQFEDVTVQPGAVDAVSDGLPEVASTNGAADAAASPQRGDGHRSPVDRQQVRALGGVGGHGAVLLHRAAVHLRSRGHAAVHLRSKRCWSSSGSPPHHPLGRRVRPVDRLDHGYCATTVPVLVHPPHLERGFGLCRLPSSPAWPVAPSTRSSWSSRGLLARGHPRDRNVAYRSGRVHLLLEPGLDSNAAFSKLSLFSILGLPISFYYGLVLVAAFAYMSSWTPLGRHMLFVGANREVARLAGIRVNRVRTARTSLRR